MTGLFLMVWPDRARRLCAACDGWMWCGVQDTDLSYPTRLYRNGWEDLLSMYIVA